MCVVIIVFCQQTVNAGIVNFVCERRYFLMFNLQHLNGCSTYKSAGDAKVLATLCDAHTTMKTKQCLAICRASFRPMQPLFSNPFSHCRDQPGICSLEWVCSFSPHSPSTKCLDGLDETSAIRRPESLLNPFSLIAFSRR
jgi:hypothetical protein